jgi:hypothetical protein
MWNDTNRYNQTGYSAPTIFPKLWQYTNKDLWEIDFAKAERRDASHLEWLEEERAEARIQELEERAERAELNYDY